MPLFQNSDEERNHAREQYVRRRANNNRAVREHYRNKKRKEEKLKENEEVLTKRHRNLQIKIGELQWQCTQIREQIRSRRREVMEISTEPLQEEKKAPSDWYSCGWPGCSFGDKSYPTLIKHNLAHLREKYGPKRGRDRLTSRESSDSEGDSEESKEPKRKTAYNWDPEWEPKGQIKQERFYDMRSRNRTTRELKGGQ